VGDLPKVDPNIVVEDDDPDFLTVVKALLEGEGFRVQTVNGPDGFWNALEASSPQALILDVDMPNIDGIDLCRVVRNDPRWGGLPLMFLTAHNDADVMTRAFAAGADDFLHKRLVKDELVPRLVHHISVHRISSKRPTGAPPTASSASRTEPQELFVPKV